MDCHLMGHDTMCFRWISTFQKNMLLLSSGLVQVGWEWSQVMLQVSRKVLMQLHGKGI
jgi:hypothetical protein